MAVYYISYTERKVNGDLKKNQGVRVNRFRKLLQSQKIAFEEETLPPHCYDYSNPMWTRREWLRKSYQELSEINSNIIVRFSFSEGSI